MKANYTTTWINQNFRMVVQYINEFGKRVRKLVGVSGLVKLIGREMMDKFITRALNHKKDKEICKLRGGKYSMPIVVSLYVK